MDDVKLKPCPFCGGNAYIDSNDRLISIGCNKCNYRRTFLGLLTNVPHNVIASAPGTPIVYYNPNAYEEAAESWNRRAYEPNEP